MKNILIIGGSSGIGQASAALLSKEHCVFATFNTHSIDDQNIQSFHLNVLDETLDFASLPDVLDGLVYCPGSINLKPFGRIQPNDFIEDYKLQVVGAVKVIQAILPRLKKSESASIVLFSTVAVQMGFNFHTLVSASKGSIEGLTKALAAELAPKIRVNAIAPSITNTPLAGSILNTPEKIDANGQRHPLRRVGEPGDIAGAVAFLISDASSWMSGQIVHIDGGMSSLKI